MIGTCVDGSLISWKKKGASMSISQATNHSKPSSLLSTGSAAAGLVVDEATAAVVGDVEDSSLLPIAVAAGFFRIEPSPTRHKSLVRHDKPPGWLPHEHPMSSTACVHRILRWVAEFECRFAAIERCFLGGCFVVMVHSVSRATVAVRISLIDGENSSLLI